jgi:mannose-binding lectin 2
MLKSTLSALWLATLAWGRIEAEDDKVKSIGVRCSVLRSICWTAMLTVFFSCEHTLSSRYEPSASFILWDWPDFSIQPYLDSDMQSRWYDFGGDTIVRTDQ